MPAWLDIIGVGGGIAGTLTGLFAYRASRQDRDSDKLGEVHVKLDDIGRRLSRVETQMEPFWAAVQADLIKLLHHPWPERADMDALLDKLDPDKPGHITPAERAELKQILELVISDDPDHPPPFPVSANERVFAVFLLHTMDLVRS